MATTRHRQISREIRDAKTAQERNKLEMQHSIYYSLISDLEYFDPIKHCIIDSMRNLFLGTAKRIYKKIWILKGLLNDKRFRRNSSVCG